MVDSYQIVVIGGGPAGAATAIEAARAGVKVAVFERAEYGRDKVCGDGLTPRAIAALNDLGVKLDAAHRIDGLRMIAGKTRRELPWPDNTRFPAHGAVWPRRRLDAALLDAASEAGADIFFNCEALPLMEAGKAVGVEVTPRNSEASLNGQQLPARRTVRADLVVLAAGAPGPAARILGAERNKAEPFGLAIRGYAETPRHDDRLLEASLALNDPEHGPIPGYGWMFPAGDGTVNIGAGALSTMKGFKKLNLNRLYETYRNQVQDEWQLGADIAPPRAWRLPMSAQRRHGPGWLAVGDAAGFVNPMNGEGIDYGLESGALAAQIFVRNPQQASQIYNQRIGERFDAFLRTGRRFSFLIGHPLILHNGLKFAVGTQTVANITLAVMGNLLDSEEPGPASTVLKVADKSLAALDPILRKTRARS